MNPTSPDPGNLDPRLRRMLLAGMFAMLMAYAAVVYHLRIQIAHGYSDFISFYAAGKILQGGQADRLYDLNLQYQVQQEYAREARIRAGALPYVRPPFEAWLFVPLARVSYLPAFLLWDAFTFGCIVSVIVLARLHIPGLHGIPVVLFILALVSYFPIFLTLIQGQDAGLLMLIVFLSYMALRRSREFVGGMILALGTFKFHIILLFLLPFAVARRVRILAGFCLVSLLLAGVSLWTTGWHAFSEYPSYLLGIDKLARGVNQPQDMPNIRGLVDVILGSYVSSAIKNATIGASSLLLLGWLSTKQRLFTPGTGPLFSLALSLDLVITMLVSYHAHVFDLALLVPFLALGSGLLLSDRSLSASARKTLGFAVGLTLLSPLYFVISMASRNTTLLAVMLLAVAVALSRVITDVELRVRANEQGSLTLAAQ